MSTPSTGPILAYSRSQHRSKQKDASDRDLLLALKDGDETALDEIIERKTEPLVKTVYRILGDLEESRDIVQVTFFRLWDHRDRFDDRWSPNTWIYRIATNLAIDHLRSRKSRYRSHEPVKLHLTRQFESRAQNERNILQDSEVMAIFHELAVELTEKQRTVFLLREVEDMASKDVAEIVGCRESTVRNHLFNARRTLREKLIEKYPEYARGRGEEKP